MLKILPKLKSPVNAHSIDPIMDLLVQLNRLDAGIPEQTQNALSIYLHVFDIYVKSKGAIDYRGKAGHERLKQDAVRFAPSQIVTRHGDLAAAHLAIDWSETAVRCTQTGLPLPSSDVNQLLADSKDLVGLSGQLEKQIGLLLDNAGMKVITS
jgi:hypothetical protein